MKDELVEMVAAVPCDVHEIVQTLGPPALHQLGLKLGCVERRRGYRGLDWTAPGSSLFSWLSAVTGTLEKRGATFVLSESAKNRSKDSWG